MTDRYNVEAREREDVDGYWIEYHVMDKGVSIAETKKNYWREDRIGEQIADLICKLLNANEEKQILENK